ncbi:MAG: IS5/IS1182 family transposase, partial [Candidatus Thiodiazotropha endolucinida]
MKITTEEVNLIKELLPKQRGNVTISNLQVINAVLYVA